MDDSFFDLYQVSNFLDAELCRQLIEELRRAPAQAALTYGQVQAGKVDERVRRVSRLTPLHETAALVGQRLSECRERIAEHFKIGLGHCEDPQFLCYRVGDFFVAHQDGNTGMVKLETEARRVSVSIFLNDEYEGGELVFSDWRADKRFELKGEAGMLVAFRSETTHEVLPITRGERYSIVSWIR